jgi:hypothetical protein
MTNPRSHLSFTMSDWGAGANSVSVGLLPTMSVIARRPSRFPKRALACCADRIAGETLLAFAGFLEEFLTSR